MNLQDFIEYLPLIFVVIIIALLIFIIWPPQARKIKERRGLFFNSSMGRIFYQVHGTKSPPLLLIHGIGASSYCWRLLIPLLEKKHKVITIDLWGFGKSNKISQQSVTIDIQCQIIMELLDKLKIEKCHLIGSSMGGSIAFWLALNYQSHFEKIVAIAPAAHPSLVPQFLTKYVWVANLTPLFINRTIIKKALERTYFSKRIITDEVVEAYLEPYLDRNAHKTFAEALKIIQDQRVFNSLNQIKNKTLILWGEKDRTIPQWVMNEIVKKHSNNQYFTHPNIAHHPMEEDPHWCADKILAFLSPKG